METHNEEVPSNNDVVNEEVDTPPTDQTHVPPVTPSSDVVNPVVTNTDEPPHHIILLHRGGSWRNSQLIGTAGERG